MTRARAIVLVIIAAVAAVALLLPAARDELAWRWAESQDEAPDYMRYSSEWPKGRHAAEARARYDQRQWAATKRVLIRQAYQQDTRTNASADAAYGKEKRLRREVFFWKTATNVNTIESYKDYLEQYPAGSLWRRRGRESQRSTAPATGPRRQRTRPRPEGTVPATGHLLAAGGLGPPSSRILTSAAALSLAM